MRRTVSVIRSETTADAGARVTSGILASGTLCYAGYAVSNLRAATIPLFGWAGPVTTNERCDHGRWPCRVHYRRFPREQVQRPDRTGALAKLINGGLVRILDLVVISKGESGEIGVFEFDQLDELAPFSDLEGDVGGILGQEDIDYAAASLEPGSSLGLLVWEDLWAAPFAAAVRESGGVLLEGGRVPHELAQEALARVEPAG